MSVYFRICPHCQNVCTRFEYNLSSLEDNGYCYHEDFDFKYCYSKSKNSTVIDIISGDVYMMIEIVGKNKKCLLKTDIGEVLLEGNIPINWSNFDLSNFTSRVHKIVEMKTFY